MKIHFIGIGGVGMSALAQLHAMGKDEVTGSDRLISKGYTDMALWDYLKKLNINLFPQDGSGIDEKTDLVGRLRLKITMVDIKYLVEESSYMESETVLLLLAQALCILVIKDPASL